VNPGPAGSHPARQAPGAPGGGHLLRTTGPPGHRGGSAGGQPGRSRGCGYRRPATHCRRDRHAFRRHALRRHGCHVRRCAATGPRFATAGRRRAGSLGPRRRCRRRSDADQRLDEQTTRLHSRGRRQRPAPFATGLRFRGVAGSHHRSSSLPDQHRAGGQSPSPGRRPGRGLTASSRRRARAARRGYRRRPTLGSDWRSRSHHGRSGHRRGSRVRPLPRCPFRRANGAARRRPSRSLRRGPHPHPRAWRQRDRRRRRRDGRRPNHRDRPRTHRPHDPGQRRQTPRRGQLHRLDRTLRPGQRHRGPIGHASYRHDPAHRPAQRHPGRMPHGPYRHDRSRRPRPRRPCAGSTHPCRRRMHRGSHRHDPAHRPGQRHRGRMSHGPYQPDRSRPPRPDRSYAVAIRRRRRRTHRGSHQRDWNRRPRPDRSCAVAIRRRRRRTHRGSHQRDWNRRPRPDRSCVVATHPRYCGQNCRRAGSGPTRRPVDRSRTRASFLPSIHPLTRAAPNLQASRAPSRRASIAGQTHDGLARNGGLEKAT
jgi:hypothetical protein